MKILIKTQKPNEIEAELQKTTQKYMRQWKPSRKLTFLMKLAHIEPHTFKKTMFLDYKKTSDNTFLFIINYIGIEHTKKTLLSGLETQLKRIDDHIEISEEKA